MNVFRAQSDMAVSKLLKNVKLFSMFPLVVITQIKDIIRGQKTKIFQVNPIPEYEVWVCSLFKKIHPSVRLLF